MAKTLKSLPPQMRGAMYGAVGNAIRDRLVTCAEAITPLMPPAEFQKLNVEMQALLLGFEHFCLGEDR